MRVQRPETGRSVAKWIAGLLAIAVNLGFVLFLMFHVTWRNPAPEGVAVELYAPPQVAEKIEPKEQIEPLKPMPPLEAPKFEPPKIEPPRIEPPRPRRKPSLHRRPRSRKFR